jgi:hypothetical protein
MWANDGINGNHKAAVAVPLLHDVGRFELDLPINMRCPPPLADDPDLDLAPRLLTQSSSFFLDVLTQANP